MGLFQLGPNIAELGGTGGAGIDQGGEEVGLVVGVDAADTVGVEASREGRTVMVRPSLVNWKIVSD